MNKQKHITGGYSCHKCGPFFIGDMPGMLLIVVWPFVMHLFRIRTRLEQETFYPHGTYEDDYVLYVRNITFLILAILMAVVWITRLLRLGRLVTYKKEERSKDQDKDRNKDAIKGRIIEKDLSKDRCVGGDNLPAVLGILMGIYALLSILSGVLAKHPDAAFLGVADSFETVPVLIGYLATFLYAAQSSQTDGWKEKVSVCFLITAILMGFLGLSQITGHDFWNTGIGKWILLGGQDRTLVFDAALDGTRQVYLTFYNPNYAAVYLLMQFFICLDDTITHWQIGSQPGRENASQTVVQHTRQPGQQHTRQPGQQSTPQPGRQFSREPGQLPGHRPGLQHLRRAAGCAAVLMTLISLYGTRSKAALLTLAILLLACVIRFLTKRRNGLKYCIVLAALAATFITIMLLLPGKNVVKRVKSNMFPAMRTYNIWDVKVREDGVHFTIRTREVHLKIVENGSSTGLQVLDAQGKDIAYHWDDARQRFVFEQPELDHFSFNAFTEGSRVHILMWHLEVEWHFVKTIGKDDYRYINFAGKEDKIERAPLAFGKGYEGAFTRRMYIWGATGSLLPQRLLLGCGAENFAYVFPQNDYIMKSNLGYQASLEWHMRPHSLYLQIAMNSGILAAICILTAVALYLINGIRNKEHKDANQTSFGFHVHGFLLAVLSFLIMGLANDSMVVVTPLFCLILGSMYGTERQNKP